MKIEKEKYVSLLYELRENDSDGRIIEELNPERPLNFIFGMGRIIPGFESGIDSLSKGDDFAFKLSPSEAYGEKREEMVVNVPLNLFEKDGKIDESICFVGNMVPMSDNTGRRIDGVIIEIGDSFVVMDFNHPLAGSSLHFSGKIVEVRDATEKELEAVRPGNDHGGCSGCSGGSSADCGTPC